MRGARVLVLLGAGCTTAAATGCSLLTHFDPPPGTHGEGSGGPSCTSSGALLCEDFENGLDMVRWNGGVTANGGTVAIDGAPDPVHWGSHSLHLRSDAAPADGATTILAWRRTAALPATLFLRAFVYWRAPLPQSVANSFEIESADRSTGFVLYAGQSELGWSNFGANVSRVASPPPTGVWTCIEWTLDGATGDLEVTVDGTVVGALSDRAAPFFPFAELDVGMLFAHDQAEPILDAWIDDLVLDVKPIGCEGD
jgi:hypothetical protein